MKNQGVTNIILSVYHKSEVIKKHYNYSYNGIKITYSNDKIPLGTGGAIRAALIKSVNKNIIVINGDTYFEAVLNKLMDTHINKKNDITLPLKPMSNFSRYGFVETEKNVEKCQQQQNPAPSAPENTLCICQHSKRIKYR